MLCRDAASVGGNLDRTLKLCCIRGHACVVILAQQLGMTLIAVCLLQAEPMQTLSKAW